MTQMEIQLIRRKHDEENDFFTDGDEVGRAQPKYSKLGPQIAFSDVGSDLNIFCNAIGCGMRFATIAQVFHHWCPY